MPLSSDRKGRKIAGQERPAFHQLDKPLARMGALTAYKLTNVRAACLCADFAVLPSRTQPISMPPIASYKRTLSYAQWSVPYAFGDCNRTFSARVAGGTYHSSRLRLGALPAAMLGQWQVKHQIRIAPRHCCARTGASGKRTFSLQRDAALCEKTPRLAFCGTGRICLAVPPVFRTGCGTALVCP